MLNNHNAGQNIHLSENLTDTILIVGAVTKLRETNRYHVYTSKHSNPPINYNALCFITISYVFASGRKPSKTIKFIGIWWYLFRLNVENKFRFLSVWNQHQFREATVWITWNICLSSQFILSFIFVYLLPKHKTIQVLLFVINLFFLQSTSPSLSSPLLTLKKNNKLCMPSKRRGKKYLIKFNTMPRQHQQHIALWYTIPCHTMLLLMLPLLWLMSFFGQSYRTWCVFMCVCVCVIYINK